MNWMKNTFLITLHFSLTDQTFTPTSQAFQNYFTFARTTAAERIPFPNPSLIFKAQPEPQILSVSVHKISLLSELLAFTACTTYFWTYLSVRNG